MLGRCQKKLHCRRGISLLVVIMLVLVAAMLVVVSIPVVRYYRKRSEAIGCATALDTAKRELLAEYMATDNIKTLKDAKKHVQYVMDGWDDLCPGGGNIYVAERENQEPPFELVCGLHGSDKQELTRLNASWVKEQIEAAVVTAKKRGNTSLTSVTLQLNGEEIIALLTENITGWKWGSSATKGLEGTMVRYGLAGYGDFARSDYKVSEGSLCYLSFVDENYCANWSSIDGWTGNSYGVYGG